MTELLPRPDLNADGVRPLRCRVAECLHAVSAHVQDVRLLDIVLAAAQFLEYSGRPAVGHRAHRHPACGARCVFSDRSFAEVDAFGQSIHWHVVVDEPFAVTEVAFTLRGADGSEITMSQAERARLFAGGALLGTPV